MWPGTATQYDFELRPVRCQQAFLRVKEKVAAGAAAQHEGQAVVRAGSRQPCLHQRRDIDEQELIATGGRDGNSTLNQCQCARCRLVIVGQRVFDPTLVHLIQVEAARFDDEIHVQAQRGLAQSGAGGDARQIELHITVGPRRHGKAIYDTKVCGGKCAGDEGIAAGRRLGHERHQRSQREQQETDKSSLGTIHITST